MLAIILNLLKQELTFWSNTFQGLFNEDFAAAKVSLVIISSSGSGNSSSCGRSGGGSSSGNDCTSGCGSGSKILIWNGKYKLEAIAEVRVCKYNLGTKTGKWKVSFRVGKHKLRATNLGQGR